MAADIVPADFTTLVGKVRALTGDTVQRIDPDAPADPAEYLFSDDQITAYLSIENDNVHFAAAACLSVLATNEALVSKKIRTEAGLQTDGPAVAKALQDAAKELRVLGHEADMAAGFGFEIVDYTDADTNPFGVRWSY
jgi:hypothetical protein